MNRSILGYAEIQQMELEELRRCRDRERRTAEIAANDLEKAPHGFLQQRFAGQFRRTVASIGGLKPHERSEARPL